jgi:hypothetical protein
MTKIIKSLDNQWLKRLQDILQRRGRWLELTGGELKRGIDMLEYAAYSDVEYPEAHEAETVCIGAIKEWRELSREIIGWALSATTGASAREWDAPDDNLARRYRLMTYLHEATNRAAASDTYVIAALSREIALKTILALKRLEEGEVDSLLEPKKRKSYKDCWTMRRFQRRIVFACHYCYGSGLSMAEARRHIARFVNETADNLRNWERKFNAEADAGDEDDALYWDQRRIKYQIAGAVAKGVTVEDAREHPGISELGKTQKPGLWASKYGFATNRWWDRCLRRPLIWDDKYLEKLGHEYHEALKEQKKQAQRRKR